MRLTTLAGIAVLAVSTAALAQVARNPVEPKNEPYANMAPATDVGNNAAANASMSNDLPPATPDTKAEAARPPRR